MSGYIRLVQVSAGYIWFGQCVSGYVKLPGYVRLLLVRSD